MEILFWAWVIESVLGGFALALWLFVFFGPPVVGPKW